MKERRILVIGDSITDIYRDFEYRKQCPDAPETPVGVSSCFDVRPGGAANVAMNIAALAPSGTTVSLISVIDNDLASAVHSLRTDADRVVYLGYCPSVSRQESIRKERITLKGCDIEDGCEEGDGGLIIRLDNRSSIDREDSVLVCNSIRSYLESNDPELIVLSDYAAGVLTDELLAELAPFKDRLLVDTKRTDLSKFSGSLLVKLNSFEHRRVIVDDPLPQRHFTYYVVTRGEMGARLTVNRRDEDARRWPQLTSTTMDFSGHDVDAVDVCGCGDTFLAGLAAGLLRYHDACEAMSFANAAASTVVTQPRTAVADLRKTLEMTGRDYETCK